jgi:hypothetical protein
MRAAKSRVFAFVAVLVVACATAATGASASNGNTNTHFKVAYWDIASVYWTCSGVHQVSKTGAITDNETCTTPMAQGAYGPYVAGTYQPNEVYYPSSYPGGCGAITPAIPGNPGDQSYWVSDAPGFNACATFFTETLTPTSSGGWTLTINAKY